MNLGQALSQVTVKFRQNELEEAENEAAVLLCYLLNFDKAHLYANTDKNLNSDQLSQLEKLVARRLGGEPAAYIIKRKEFFGIDLYVDQRVLIPRPETETLVEEAISIAADKRGKLSIADVGTVSGAIAIALAKHITDAKIFAIDISKPALEVAAVNIEYYGLQDRIVLLQGELLKPVNRKLDIVVANLPYIASDDIAGLAPEISLYEPRVALDGGKDGTILYKSLIEQSRNKLVAGGALLMEIGEGQDEEIMSKINQVFPEADIAFIDDLLGIKRAVRIVVS